MDCEDLHNWLKYYSGMVSLKPNTTTGRTVNSIALVRFLLVIYSIYFHFFYKWNGNGYIPTQQNFVL
jgi:hypothetical protein